MIDKLILSLYCWHDP